MRLTTPLVTHTLSPGGWQASAHSTHSTQQQEQWALGTVALCATYEGAQGCRARYTGSQQARAPSTRRQQHQDSARARSRPSLCDSACGVTQQHAPPVGKPTTMTASCMQGSPLISSGAMSAQKSSSSTVSIAMSHWRLAAVGRRLGGGAWLQ